MTAAPVAVAAPALEFAVESVAPVGHAAVPTLRFRLRIDAGEASVRSLALNAQLRIAATARTLIQLGENWLGSKEAAAAMAAGASDLVTFDAMKIGGVTGWLRAAAHADPEIAELWQVACDRRREDVATVTAMLAATGPTSADGRGNEVLDVVYALSSPELFEVLVRQRGWTTERFHDWLVTALTSLALRPATASK